MGRRHRRTTPGAGDSARRLKTSKSAAGDGDALHSRRLTARSRPATLVVACVADDAPPQQQCDTDGRVMVGLSARAQVIASATPSRGACAEPHFTDYKAGTVTGPSKRSRCWTGESTIPLDAGQP